MVVKKEGADGCWLRKPSLVGRLGTYIHEVKIPCPGKGAAAPCLARRGVGRNRAPTRQIRECRDFGGVKQDAGWRTVIARASLGAGRRGDDERVGWWRSGDYTGGRQR